MKQSARPKRRGAFTMIEILVVVVILGVLAAVVLPQFLGVGDDVREITFVTDARIFVEAAKRYMIDTGEYLEDSESGELPNGWEPYIQEDKWTSGTTIGGVWDVELDSFGIKFALGVHFNGEGATRDDEYMQRIDARFDDGDLATGGFRKIGDDRYYCIIEDL